MKNLTKKQEAIQLTLFKNKNDKKFFTVNVFDPYTCNNGEIAYPVIGVKNCVFTENMLMTAIYTGKFQQGITNIISCKRKVKN